MRMPRIEMVDRNPIKLGVEILLHLPHQIAHERLEVAQAWAVLGRDDEAELVRVVLRALKEGAGIGIITMGVIEPSGLAGACGAVALDVAQMGACRADVARPLARVPRPNNDAPAAGRDQAGAGEDARRHAAPPRARQDVAPLPHRAGAGFASLLENALRCAKIAPAFRLANATQLGLEVVGGHDAVLQNAGELQ
jgi:hypothetical protein